MQLVCRRRFPVVHYVLFDESGRASDRGLLKAARQQAERLALQVNGRADGFTLIYNGRMLARVAKPHVHIVLARSRWHKALIYLLIGLKNLLPTKIAEPVNR
ncbi:hypothetical protein [Pseudomarimonas arenosa]|uniref:Transposase n=1 Tax=Pseudomarimonas arenosa TaxID=2774145 RepID=A0AAW3ZPN7_9GAMM|nr:hypothetical protein [Pseudomarimonas arenosa]MBD8527112.1 hypothetical protein [Pseudomarimonas arenosa]